MATQRPQTLPPIWERSTKKTTKVHVYVNGDRHYPGREVNIFKRSNFDTWLDDLTWMFKPRKGRFCRVYTPTAGHRVNSLDSLQDGDKVVAACRSERFQPVGYEDIARNLRKRPPNNLDVEAGRSRQYQVSSRYKKVDTVGIIIHVCLNGQTVDGAKHLLLRPNRPASLPYVLDCVSDAYKLPRSVAIDRLFVLPTGEEVRGLEQIKANGSYVACRKGENFLPLEYRDNPRPNILTSPRLEKKQLPPITRSTKAGSQSTPEHSISSNNGYRRERAKREEDGVFHHRPVKYKRSSEKARKTDYDQDNGGVFKAKQQNQATRGARQVDETSNTKTELPLDQRPAEEVKEEVNKKGKKDKKGKKQAQATRQQAAEREEKEREQQEREEREEAAKYSQESSRDAQPQSPPPDSPYRSGTELLTERDTHHLPLTPSPQRQAASANQWDHTPNAERDPARGHNSGPRGDEAGQNRDQDPVDWGLGPEEMERQGEEMERQVEEEERHKEEEERERAAITIQAQFRGMKARQHVSALRAQTQG